MNRFLLGVSKGRTNFELPLTRLICRQLIASSFPDYIVLATQLEQARCCERRKEDQTAYARTTYKHRKAHPPPYFSA
jgi:hypothetical protein